LGVSAADQSLKNVGMTDLLDTPQGVLALQPINCGLNRGIGRAITLRESFLYFANGARPTGPKDLHNLEFQFGQLGQLHWKQLSSSAILLYAYVFCKIGSGSAQ
jgi:hypothetical protein